MNQTMNCVNIDLQHGARVVAAMSGGVDSSVVAALLNEAQYDVIGMTMQLYDQNDMAVKTKACCAGIDIYDAKTVADHLSIPHYVLDFESRFEQSVMDYFADSYLAGETPIPCIRCNQTVKFRDMLTMAKELGAEALATGHYVRRLMGVHGPELHRGLDSQRDQSYFLFTTTLSQLEFLRFPLGGMPKSETRAQARRFDLPVHDKPDSQDICFVPNGDYASVVERLRPGALEAGNIVHSDGRILGQHNGIINYTVGQRRGIGVGDGSGDPLYVVRLDPLHHNVIVGPKSELARRVIKIRDINWLLYNQEDNSDFQDIAIKFRSSQEPIAAHLNIDHDHKIAVITLVESEYGIAHGQACVFYKNSRVLGGGWIFATE